jgi:hypothetical protein
LSVDDIEAMPDPRWLVDGLLPEQGLAVAYGPPKHGKSFILLSMALHIAAGKPWFGKEILQGGVIYIAGEGAGGLKQRIRAARAHYGLSADIPFWAIPRTVNFGDPRAIDELAAAIREAAEDVPVRLIIIDTLARSMPGLDENSAGEVGRVIAACDRLRDELRCCIMPVHHQGKDSEKGMRGSSALDGAVDTLLHVSRQTENGDIVTLATKYQKDAEEAAPILFDMVKVAATAERSSLVPVLRSQPLPNAKADRLPRGARVALEILGEMSTLHGKRMPDGRVAVAIAEWRRECSDNQRVSTSDDREARGKAFRRAFQELLDRKMIAEGGGFAWVPAQGDEFTFDEPLASTGQTGQTGQTRTMSGLSGSANRGEEPDGQDTPLKGCPVCPVPAMPGEMMKTLPPLGDDSGDLIATGQTWTMSGLSGSANRGEDTPLMVVRRDDETLATLGDDSGDLIAGDAKRAMTAAYVAAARARGAAQSGRIVP